MDWEETEFSSCEWLRIIQKLVDYGFCSDSNKKDYVLKIQYILPTTDHRRRHIDFVESCELWLDKTILIP